jgi:hypothetical protein
MYVRATEAKSKARKNSALLRLVQTSLLQLNSNLIGHPFSFLYTRNVFSQCFEFVFFSGSGDASIKNSELSLVFFGEAGYYNVPSLVRLKRRLSVLEAEALRARIMHAVS